MPDPVQPQAAPQEEMMEVPAEGGKKVLQPKSVVTENFRFRSQLENDRAKLEADKKRFESKVAFTDAVMNAAAVDPKMAKEQVSRWIDMQTGATPAAQPAARADVDVDESGGDPKLASAITKIEERLAGIEQRDYARDTKVEVTNALNAYPLLTKDQQARELAELLITQQRALNSRAPIDQLVAEAHTRILALKGQEVQQERDTRQQRQQTMPTLPAAAGSPEIAAPKRMTEKDLRDGTMRKRWEESYRQTGYDGARRAINGRR